MRTLKVRLVVLLFLFAVACVSQPVEPPGTTLPSATDPPATQPPPTVIPAGVSWTDAINATAAGGTLIAGPDDHGTKDLSNLDAHGVTVECQPDTKVRRFRLINVSHLTLRNCVMTPAVDTVGVYIVGGENIRIEGFTITGGERSVLIQNDRAKVDGWTDGVWIEHGTFSTPKIDTVAVYGGRNIHVLNNHMTLTPYGCDANHADGFQSNSIIGLELVGNLIEGDSTKDPRAPDNVCPNGSPQPGYPHDQAIVLTQAVPLVDRAEDALIRDNVVKNWLDGISILVDRARTRNVRLIDNTVDCGLRGVKITGTGGDVIETGSVFIPCPE